MPTLYRKLNQSLYRTLYSNDATGEPHQKPPVVHNIPSTVSPVRPLYRTVPGQKG